MTYEIPSIINISYCTTRKLVMQSCVVEKKVILANQVSNSSLYSLCTYTLEKGMALVLPQVIGKIAK